jgi:hypothetical protein
MMRRSMSQETGRGNQEYELCRPSLLQATVYISRQHHTRVTCVPIPVSLSASTRLLDRLKMLRRSPNEFERGPTENFCRLSSCWTTKTSPVRRHPQGWTMTQKNAE